MGCRLGGVFSLVRVRCRRRQRAPAPSATQQTAAQLAADVDSAVQLTMTASGLSPWLTNTKANSPDAPAWTTAWIHSDPCYVGAPQNINLMRTIAYSPETPDPVGVAAQVVAALKAHGYKTGYMGPPTGTGGIVTAQGIAPHGTSVEFDISAEGGGISALSVCSTDKSLHH